MPLNLTRQTREPTRVGHIGTVIINNHPVQHARPHHPVSLLSEPEYRLRRAQPIDVEVHNSELDFSLHTGGTGDYNARNPVLVHQRHNPHINHRRHRDPSLAMVQAVVHEEAINNIYRGGRNHIPMIDEDLAMTQGIIHEAVASIRRQNSLNGITMTEDDLVTIVLHVLRGNQYREHFGLTSTYDRFSEDQNVFATSRPLGYMGLGRRFSTHGLHPRRYSGGEYEPGMHRSF